MTTEFDDLINEETVTSTWRQSLTWCSLFVLAMLVYEFTTQPILGVIVICSKFGWNEFLMAYFLPRTDPNRSRSRALFWFCLAYGLLRVSFASTFLAIVLCFLGTLFGPGGFQAMLLRVIAAVGVFLVGCLLITAAVFRGACCARQSQIKVWITSDLPVGHRLENLIDLLVESALFPIALLGLLLIPIVAVILGAQGLLRVAFITGQGLWGLFVYSLLRKLFLRIKKRISAADPLECWECDPLSKVMIAKIPSGRRVRLLIQLNQALAQTEA